MHMGLRGGNARGGAGTGVKGCDDSLRRMSEIKRVRESSDLLSRTSLCPRSNAQHLCRALERETRGAGQGSRDRDPIPFRDLGVLAFIPMD
ncbi:hypothetical protein Acr_20g0006000 [Actinidia rufa]|uniref:Uncharacterized protein n=1 Tax=Actinidia rufa TaxID=165716 RepID=A0A7J0GDG8_9ERIC|nr:hypothetical protein Acr_20g0006000 [Actinidia rufa]